MTTPGELWLGQYTIFNQRTDGLNMQSYAKTAI